MAKKALDPFVTYYQRELSYLRQASNSFALEHPKIARRLELGRGESADPHVERLLESFSYLTANLQRELDDKFPRISTALLGVLYPQFTSPLPAMTIAHFQAQANKGKLDEALRVPKESALLSRSSDGAICSFRTCYDFDLLPLKVTQGELVSTDSLDVTLPNIKTRRVLRLRVEGITVPLRELDINDLRFYINGDRPRQNAIYEMLFTQDASVCTLGDDQVAQAGVRARAAPGGNVTPVGYSSDELVIPFSEPSHPAYTLLYEYFNFPNKFMFFNVEGISFGGAAKHLDIFISVPDSIISTSVDITDANFALNCVPVINLFSKISEPLRMDNRSAEYQLHPDYRKEKTTEIHSITEVYSVNVDTRAKTTIAPYFSYNHFESNRVSQNFWSARRIPTTISNAQGSDMMLSFVDYNFNPAFPSDENVYAKILCTNRTLAESLTSGSLLESEDKIPAQIVCIDKPTKQYYPPDDGETQWRLISQLAVNHISVVTGKDGTDAVKELLEIYANLTQTRIVEEAEAIVSIAAKEVTRQVRRADWRGFASGVHIDMVMSEKSFGAGGALLFASVMNEFFALYATINSFTELSLKVKDQQGEWKRWKPNLGDKFLI